MKELIVYYSFSGNTKKYAEELARSINADLCEITEAKNRSKFGAFTRGIVQTFKAKKSKINPVTADFSQYDKIIIASPIWASHQPPAINSAIDLLPKDKDIEIIFISASGKSDSTQITDMINSKKCKVVSVKNIKI